MELLLGEHNAEVGHRNIIFVDVVAVLLRLEGGVDKADKQFMSVQAVLDVLTLSLDLLAQDGFRVELVGGLKRVGGYGHQEGGHRHALIAKLYYRSVLWEVKEVF